MARVGKSALENQTCFLVRRGRQAVRTTASDICLKLDRPKGVWGRHGAESRVDRCRTEDEAGKGLQSL